MCTHLAAANEYKITHLRSPAIWPLVEQASVYFVGGYHLTVCPPAILALAEEAAQKNKVFILSLSAPFIPQFFKEPLDQTSPYWDYVIGNETEARSFAESHKLKETKDVREIARYMAELPKENSKRKRTVVITQGTEPTVVAVQGDEDVRQYEVHEIAKEKICDTTGAGCVSLSLFFFFFPLFIFPFSPLFFFPLPSLPFQAPFSSLSLSYLSLQTSNPSTNFPPPSLFFPPSLSFSTYPLFKTKTEKRKNLTSSQTTKYKFKKNTVTHSPAAS